MKKLCAFFVLSLLLSDLLGQTVLDSTFLNLFKYRHVGPTRGGRVTCVAGIASQANTFYMGATGGGVWKTTDYGINWENVSDGYFATPSIGDIQVAQNNPEIVYVGTGSDGIRSNIISGKGMYKSEDAGKSWTHKGLKECGQIGAVEIHPTNPDIVFVAAIGQAFNPNPERGIYRSRDGGENWEQVYFHSDTIGAVDLEFHPTNPDIIYAALWRAERKPWTIISGGYQAGGILKSNDGGSTWVKLENGLPQGLIGKADLAVSAADPDRLYALIEAPEETKEGGLYRSDDLGESFRLISSKKELLDRPFYYCNIEADPNNADVIYSLATSYYKSEDAGENWKRQSVPHGDNHDLWINPNNSDIHIQCNDGGANVSLNGGKSWSTQLNQPTAEIYQVEVDDQFPYWLYGGQQDNTTISVLSNPPFRSPAGARGFWMSVGGCETGPAVPKPGNHNIVYSNCKGRFGTFNKISGQEQQFYVGASNMYGHNPKELKYRFQRVAPIFVSPHNPDWVYHCSQYVHLTKDDGKTWETISPDLTAFEDDKQVISGSPITRDVTGEEFYSTIYSIRESSLQRGLIWVGANDGPVHLTQNGGSSWEDVTPDMPKGGRVDAVEPSPHKTGKAYVSILRYQLGDWKPYIYKTIDYGKTWDLITNGIPSDYPVRVVREDPDRKGLLYAGTEYGLFISTDDGKNWQSFQQNLPVTPVTDIKVHQKDLVLSTMGRGFWILDNLSPLHQVASTNSDLFVLKVADTYRTPRIRGGSDVEYKTPGAEVFYFVPDSLTGEITIQVLNALGKEIKSFTSKQQATEEQGSTDMATGFFRARGGAKGLKKSQGWHKLNWDMRHWGAWDEESPKGSSYGPFVSPGEYTIQLQADTVVLEQKVTVLIDPRLEAAAICIDDLIQQEKLALNVRDLQSEAKKLSANIKVTLDEIKALPEKKQKKKRAEREDLESLYAELNTADGRYMKPMLLSQISYLNSMINRADQVPGQDAYQRYEELKNAYIKLKDRANKVL